METRTGSDAEQADQACHEVLLAIAGRLPDRLLWRLRDWLACRAHIALRAAVPRALLRHRVGVTEDERDRLRAAVTAWGGQARLVDTVLHADAAPTPSATFLEPGAGPGWDDTDLVLRAIAPVVGGVEVLRRAWRTGPAGAPPVRVVLVGTATDPDAPVDPTALTGALQAALRARGELDPCVEVLGPGAVPGPYHRAALDRAEVLWRRPRDGGLPTGRERTATGELVGHG